jgi:hypothetical protein
MQGRRDPMDVNASARTCAHGILERGPQLIGRPDRSVSVAEVRAQAGRDRGEVAPPEGEFGRDARRRGR